MFCLSPWPSKIFCRNTRTQTRTCTVPKDMFNQTAAAAPLFGNDSTSSEGLFGNSKRSRLSSGANANASAPALGGFGQNQTASSTSLFGSNINTPPGQAGTQSSANLGTGSSLFGQNQSQQQSGSLFGNSTNRTSLGASPAPQNSLFSNPAPILSVPSQNESLFQKNSLFSVSSSDADAAKFRQSLNSQQQPNQVDRNSLYPSSPNINITTNTAMPLRHSQSSITLGNGPGYRRSNTPSWATEKRMNGSTSSNLRHVSSFNTSDRGSLAVRKASPSQSPTNSFGSSFSGISKPSHIKKKAVIQEDPPPARSIYDTSSYNPSMGHKGDASLNLSRRKSVISNMGTPVPSTPRMVKTIDHSLSVVIFGFPSSVTPAVVAHFSRFGTILENVDSSSRFPITASPNKSLRAPPTPIQTGKNWLKITYDNAASASRAIQENGTLIAGQYVVGCIPVTPQNYKEFEIASETSMHSGLRSPTESIGEYSIFDESTVDFTDGNILPPSEHEGSNDHSAILGVQNGKSIGRTVSMPSLAGGKRVQLKDGRTIFNKTPKQVRYSPSLFQIAQEPDQDTKTAVKKVNGLEGDKRLQAGKQGWMSWTSKKAQELVFGWDDL